MLLKASCQIYIDETLDQPFVINSIISDDYLWSQGKSVKKKKPTLILFVNKGKGWLHAFSMSRWSIA